MNLSSQPQPDRPSSARMYSYWLGGDFWFDVDKTAAERVAQVYPDVFASARANRAFLRRAVTAIAGKQGIDQFIDLGAGLPVANAVHEVAGEFRPGVKVVYVDNDPVTIQEGRQLLAGNPHVVMLEADARDPQAILESAEVNRLIDFDKPVALLALTILNYFVEDAVVGRLLRSLTALMIPGSALAITHGTYDSIPADIVAEVDKVYAGTNARNMIMRTTAQIRALFDGFDLLDPGLVYTPLWRPDNPSDPLQDRPEKAVALAGVGLKRG